MKEFARSEVEDTNGEVENEDTRGVEIAERCGVETVAKLFSLKGWQVPAQGRAERR